MSFSLAIRNRAILGLMLDTGLRRAEESAATLTDLDLDNCLLTVTGKGNKQRRFPGPNMRTLLRSTGCRFGATARTRSFGADARGCG